MDSRRDSDSQTWMIYCSTSKTKTQTAAEAWQKMKLQTFPLLRTPSQISRLEASVCSEQRSCCSVFFSTDFSGWACCSAIPWVNLAHRASCSFNKTQTASLMALILCLYVCLFALQTRMHAHPSMAQEQDNQGKIHTPAVNWKGQRRGWAWVGVEVSKDKWVQRETAPLCPFMANHIPLSGFCPVMRMLLALSNNPITDHKGSWGCVLRALKLLL